MSKVVYKISGQHDATAVNQAKQGLMSLGDSVNKLNGLFNAFIGLKVVQGIGKAANDTVKAFTVQQSALTQLTHSISNNANMTTNSLKNIVAFTGQLQKRGIFGDEELQKQATYLASLGLTEQGVKDVLLASAELASKGVMPLDSAVKNMSKQFSGMAGELGEKIPALKSLTAEQLKAGEGIALIQKQFAGSLETAASTLEGRTKQVENIVGDIKEKIGSLFAVGKMGVLNAIEPFLLKLDQWLANNQERIIGFFVNLPEVISEVFSRIAQIQQRVMTLDFWVQYFRNLGTFIIDTWKLIFGAIVDIMNAIGTAIWEPLKYGFLVLIADIKLLFAKVINFFSDGLFSVINGAIDKLNSLPEWMRFGKTIEKVGQGSKLNENIPLPQHFGQAVTDSFKNIGTNFVDRVNTASKSFTAIFTDGFGDIVSGFGEKLGQIVGQELPEGIRKFLNPQGDGDNIAGGVGSADGSVNPTKSYNSEDYGDRASDAGMHKPSWMDKIGEALGPLFDMFTSMSSLTQIMQPLQIVFQGIFSVLAPIIDSLLKPLIGIFRIIGETIGKVLAPVLMRLSPVIELIAKAFVFLYNYALMPFSNMIVFVITAVYNMIAAVVNGVIKVVNKIPGVNIRWRMDKMDYDAMKLPKISEADLNSAGDRSTGTSTSTGAGSTSASYSGPQSITNNVYIDVENMYGTDEVAAIKFWDTLVDLSKSGRVTLALR